MLTRKSRFIQNHLFTMLSVFALLAISFTTVIAQDDDEVTIVHAQGETVVPVNPQVVLTFDLATLSTLDALGIEVAGVPDFIYPENLAQYAGDEYIKIGSLFEPDYEQVNALEPDLIIVAARSSTVYPQLSELAPTIDLTAPWGEGYLEAQQANAEIIGQIFDREEEVAELWSDIEADIAAVEEVASEAGNALIILTSGGEVTAYGTDSRFGWIHNNLGFAPVIDDIEAATHGEAISFEFILEANPDWLIVVDRDVAIGQEADAAAVTLDNELIAQTTAWQEDQVIYINPSNWYILMGGLGAIQEMVDEIALALDVDTDMTVDIEVTEEAEVNE